MFLQLGRSQKSFEVDYEAQKELQNRLRSIMRLKKGCKSVWGRFWGSKRTTKLFEVDFESSKRTTKAFEVDFGAQKGLQKCLRSILRLKKDWKSVWGRFWDSKRTVEICGTAYAAVGSIYHYICTYKERRKTNGRISRNPKNAPYEAWQRTARTVSFGCVRHSSCRRHHETRIDPRATQWVEWQSADGERSQFGSTS